MDRACRTGPCGVVHYPARVESRRGPTVASVLATARVWPLVAGVLALAGTLAATAGAPVGYAVGLVYAALLVVAIRNARAVRRGRMRPTGTYLVPRVLAPVCAAAVLPDDVGALTWGALGVAAALVLAEPVLARLARLAAPFAAHVPDVRLGPERRVPLAWVFATSTLIGAVALAVAAAGLPDLVLAVVPIGLAIGLASAVESLVRIRARRRFEARLPQVLAGLAPRFAVHWEAPGGNAYQLAMWTPYLDRLGVPYVVVVRTETNFFDAVGVTATPVLLRPSLQDLDAVVTPSLRTVFYVNTATRNAQLVRFWELTHVQLNHGDSDKAASFNPVIRMYDKYFVAGRAAIDRFAAHGIAMPADIFEVVGRPQVEGVLPASGPVADIEHPTVLYAPTWAGFYADSNHCSLPVGPRIVRALLERECTVVFRPHPYARRAPELARACDEITEMLVQDRRVSGRAHVHGEQAEIVMSVVECMNASDAMIADVSSVVGDYLFSEKPFAMVAVASTPEVFRADVPMSRAAYVIDAADGRSAGLDASLGPVLDDLLGSDPLAGERAALKTYYLGDIPTEGYAQRFVDVARAYV